MGLGLGVAPELRSLIEAIEQWPSNVSHARAAAEKAAGKQPASTSSAAPIVVTGDADLENAGDEPPDALDHHLQSVSNTSSMQPQRKLALTSSLRGPNKRHLSSMVSAAPQRDEEWRRSALGPELGPGSYTTSIEAMREFGTPGRVQPKFASTIPQRPKNLGLVGEPPPPDGMYTHSSAPTKVMPAIHGGATFRSLGARFDEQSYLNSIRLGQQPKIPRREITHWHRAPTWEGPFRAIDGTAEGQVLPPGPDHEERLAAARASVQS